MLDFAPYPRLVEPRLAEALAHSPAVLLHGPRQCGKTTLALMTCGAAPGDADTGNEQNPPFPTELRGYGYVTFDNEASRKATVEDPIGFLAGLPERVILDEVQRVPELFTTLKLFIDRKRTNGRFLLMGSAHVLSNRKLADSLAGRLWMLRLHPFAQCELERTRPDFLDRLFGTDLSPPGPRFPMKQRERLGRALADRIASGGYPAMFNLSAGHLRTAWYRDYLSSQIQRDILDLSRIELVRVLPLLIELAAARTAQLLNVSSLASSFRLSAPTVSNYLTLLENVFLLERLPPWRPDPASRAVKTPKLHLVDTGVACAALNLDTDGLMADRGLLGRLLETFVLQELQRQASWHDTPPKFFHFRDKNDAEVDIVIERGPNEVAGIEVKAKATVGPEDFRGLRRLRKVAGERFAGGVVLYDGEMALPFGPGFQAVPVRRLWERD